jgi:hypothetical protein
MTLAGIGDQQVAEHGLSVAGGSLWLIFDGAGE